MRLAACGWRGADMAERGRDLDLEEGDQLPAEAEAAEGRGGAGRVQPEETSIWKKEITFRRKPKPPKVEAAPAPVQAGGDVGLEEGGQLPAEAEAAEGRGGGRPPVQPVETSVWKKEVSFRRKPKPPKVEAAAAPVKPAETSVWSRRSASGGAEAAEVEAAAAASLRRRRSGRRRSSLRRSRRSSAGPTRWQAPVPVPERRPEQAFIAAGHAAGLAAGNDPGSTADRSCDRRSPCRTADRGAADRLEPPSRRPVALPAAAARSRPSEAAPDPEPEQTPRRRDVSAAVPGGPPSRRARQRRQAAKEERKAAPRHKQLVGLKVGGSQIAAAQVVNKGGPRIVRMAREPLERGVVVGGELREPDELAAALKTLFRKNKLPRNCVRLGISNNRIGVRTFEICGIDDPKQLANAIRFRAQETLPIPLDEAVLDYRILEERVGRGRRQRTHRVLLVVAHRELVDRYVAACRKAGLKLVGIDLEAFALLRALGDPAQPPLRRTTQASSASRSVTTARRSPSRTAGYASSPACSPGAARHSTRRSPACSTSTPSQVEPIKLPLSLAEDSEVAGLDPCLPTRRAGRWPPSCRCSPASSSPRCASTRSSPARSGSARSSSPAGRPPAAGSRPSSSG